MHLSRRYAALDEVLMRHAPLWRALPFREARPAWCGQWQELAANLLALEDSEVEALAADNGALVREIARFLPQMAELAELIALPRREEDALPSLGAHFSWEIPGRKAQQIRAFAAALGPVTHPVLEWCGGKGHLGRFLGATWGVAVATLERDGLLCAEGERLARRAGVGQEFRVEDALDRAALARASGQHAVALHACGDLHLALVRGARAAGLAALDVAPCCYYRTIEEPVAVLAGGGFRPQREDLRLAVRDTVTASRREVGLRRQEMAWKSAFVHWRSSLAGEGYRSFKPVPDAWLRNGFEEFCRLLAQREGLAAPATGDLAGLEQLGWHRAREVERLSLLRLAFRRPLEIWLALDRALCLAGQGYEVRVAEFCPRPLTPRNILISAR